MLLEISSKKKTFYNSFGNLKILSQVTCRRVEITVEGQKALESNNSGSTIKIYGINIEWEIDSFECIPPKAKRGLKMSE